jgi:hypothetical protein
MDMSAGQSTNIIRDWRQPEEDFEDIMDRKEIKSTDVGNGKHRKTIQIRQMKFMGSVYKKRWNRTA